MAELNISGFGDLLRAARQQPEPQRLLVVFVAGLAGHAGRAPTSKDAEAPLQRMVDAIQAGAHGSFIPFDRDGRPVLFE